MSEDGNRIPVIDRPRGAGSEGAKDPLRGTRRRVTRVPARNLFFSPLLSLWGGGGRRTPHRPLCRWGLFILSLMARERFIASLFASPIEGGSHPRLSGKGLFTHLRSCPHPPAGSHPPRPEDRAMNDIDRRPHSGLIDVPGRSEAQLQGSVIEAGWPSVRMERGARRKRHGSAVSWRATASQRG